MSTDISEIRQSLDSVMGDKSNQWTWTSCGLTSASHSIPALIHEDTYSPDSKKARVLVIVGSSDTSDRAHILDMLFRCYMEHPNQDGIALSLIPATDVDSVDSTAGGTSDLCHLGMGYPPTGKFYQTAKGLENQYLWRWIAFNAPDLLLEIQIGGSVRWEANDAVADLPLTVGASHVSDYDSLVGAIGKIQNDTPGAIPGLRLTVTEDNLVTETKRLLDVIGQTRGWHSSAARKELDRRRNRDYLDIGKLLSKKYGRDLDVMVYTKGVGISGRLILSSLIPHNSGVLDDLDGVIEPVLNGERELFGKNPGSSSVGGIIWAYDLAILKNDKRAEELLIRSAECFVANGKGLSPECTDPNFRVEDMFNCNAILGRAYRLTGDAKYVDIMSEFLLSADTQQENGLFIHSRGAPYYWGRGNGFAALGFAETLTYMPEDHQNRGSLLEIHLRHLGSLRDLQQASGMYWQMLDLPGSYQEFTCTCMVGYSMARGIRLGWLDSSFMDSANLAWQGVAERIDDDGNIVDGCISTGVQSSVQEYLDREAIFGRDDRSGSLALWFAVEMQLLKDSFK
jgi:hypothetical protein